MPNESAATKIFELQQVSKVYELGQTKALQNVNLTIHEGEFLAIMGPSGSGKSTLLNLMGALDQPTSGTLRFRGQPLEPQAANHYRAQKAGFIFQAFHLLPNLTALENVQIPMLSIGQRSTVRKQKARELLEAVGLGERSHHYPRHLSGGEQQRVAIARALANDPAVLLADEPTGNLDTRTGKTILDLLERLRQQRQITILIATHNEQVAHGTQRIIRILDSQIVFDEPVT